MWHAGAGGLCDISVFCLLNTPVNPVPVSERKGELGLGRGRPSQREGVLPCPAPSRTSRSHLHPWSLRSFSQVSLKPLAANCGFSLVPGEGGQWLVALLSGPAGCLCSGGSGRDQAMYGCVCIAEV